MKRQCQCTTIYYYYTHTQAHLVVLMTRLCDLISHCHLVKNAPYLVITHTQSFCHHVVHTAKGTLRRKRGERKGEGGRRRRRRRERESQYKLTTTTHCPHLHYQSESWFIHQDTIAPRGTPTATEVTTKEIKLPNNGTQQQSDVLAHHTYRYNTQSAPYTNTPMHH